MSAGVNAWEGAGISIAAALRARHREPEKAPILEDAVATATTHNTTRRSSWPSETATSTQQEALLHTFWAARISLLTLKCLYFGQLARAQMTSPSGSHAEAHFAALQTY